MTKIIGKIEMTGQQIGRKHAIWLAGVSLSIAAIFASPEPVITPASAAPSAIADPTGSALTSKVQQFMRDADSALKTGNLNLAVIELKNAVQLAPNAGEPRARLGLALLQQGQAVAAERELRQAQKDKAPEELVVPGILNAMLARNETKQLLIEFPEPPAGATGGTTPDILKSRAFALQRLGSQDEAISEIDRALKLRRDVPMLLARMVLAQQQNNPALAHQLVNEILKSAPANQIARMMSVELFRQSGQLQNALGAANDYVQLDPRNGMARALRAQVFLDLNLDDKAKVDVDSILQRAPKSLLGHFYHAVLVARTKDFKTAWNEILTLPAQYIQGQSDFAITAAQIAISSGNTEAGASILAGLVERQPDLVSARLLLAGVETLERHPEAALKTLEPVKESNEPRINAVLAQAYLQLRRYGDATTALKKATSQGAEPENELLRRQLAITELQIGENDQGIQQLQQLAEADPGNPGAAGLLTLALLRNGKLDSALAAADRLANTQPKSPFPYFYRGAVLVAQNKLAAAYDAFGQALVADPKFVPALYYRSDVAVARGNHDGAIKDLRHLLAVSPGETNAYLKLAQIAYSDDRQTDVPELLTEAVKSAAKDPNPRFALANYEISRGKYQDARSTVDALLQAFPNNPEGLALRGRIQMATGAQRDGVATFRALVALNPQLPAAQGLLANALYAVKDFAGAENAAKAAIALAPNDSRFRAILVDYQFAEGKRDAPLATAQQFATAYPGPIADLLLSNTLLRLNRTNDASATLVKSLATKPDPAVALELERLTFMTGDKAKAVRILSDWVRSRPDDFDMRVRYASLLMQTGDHSRARREFEELLKKRPEDPIVLNNLGWLLEKDDPSRALSMVSLAFRIAPRSPNIEDTLGWMKFQHNDAQGSIPLLKHAYDVSSDNPEIGYHLAVALDAIGKHAEAKTLLKLVLAKNSSFDDAQTARQLMARW